MVVGRGGVGVVRRRSFPWFTYGSVYSLYLIGTWTFSRWWCVLRDLCYT